MQNGDGILSGLIFAPAFLPAFLDDFLDDFLDALFFVAIVETPLRDEALPQSSQRGFVRGHSLGGQMSVNSASACPKLPRFDGATICQKL
jgi:hypothetical protein